MPIFHFLGATGVVSRSRSRVQERKPVNSNYSYSVSILDNNGSSLMISITTSISRQSIQCHKLRLHSTVLIALQMSSRKGARPRCGGHSSFRHIRSTCCSPLASNHRFRICRNVEVLLLLLQSYVSGRVRGRLRESFRRHHLLFVFSFKSCEGRTDFAWRI